MVFTSEISRHLSFGTKQWFNSVPTAQFYACSYRIIVTMGIPKHWEFFNIFLCHIFQFFLCNLLKNLSIDCKESLKINK